PARQRSALAGNDGQARPGAAPGPEQPAAVGCRPTAIRSLYRPPPHATTPGALTQWAEPSTKSLRRPRPRRTGWAGQAIHAGPLARTPIPVERRPLWGSSA